MCERCKELESESRRLRNELADQKNVSEQWKCQAETERRGYEQMREALERIRDDQGPHHTLSKKASMFDDGYAFACECHAEVVEIALAPAEEDSDV
ncbi:MAG: hypothetical protein GY700_06450 [Propionibacteriaceae bacterium]|nr:hypothetical protein [Propionibacteriaceae bacterium]